MTNQDSIRSVEYHAGARERYRLSGAVFDVRSGSAPAHGVTAITVPLPQQPHLRPRPAPYHQSALRGEDYPLLQAIWDNDDDAVYDSV